MAAITIPAATRALAVQPGQPIAMTADGSTDWWQRNLTTGGEAGAWTQINDGGAVATLVRALPTSVTNRLTFDRIQIAVNTTTAPATSFTGGLHLNLCEGPPAVLWATDQIRNEAREEPPLRPWEGDGDDDPPLGLPLFMPAANRDRLGTVVQETVLEPSGPASLVGLYGPGLFVDTAGRLGARTPFTNDAVDLGRVDQAHEDVAHARAVERLVEERVLAVLDRLLQGPLANVVVERRAGCPEEDRQPLPAVEHVVDRAAERGVRFHQPLRELALDSNHRSRSSRSGLLRATWYARRFSFERASSRHSSSCL